MKVNEEQASVIPVKSYKTISSEAKTIQDLKEV